MGNFDLKKYLAEGRINLNEVEGDKEEGGTYRVYMNSDMDEPKRIDYERYFGDGTKAEMIKQAKKWAYGKDPYNQYGDPILVVVTHEDDINDVAWTNSKLYDVNHDFFDKDGNEYIDYDREEYDYSESVNEGKGIDLADRYVAKLRQEFKNLSDDEVNEFRKAIAEAFDLRWLVYEGPVNEAMKFSEDLSRIIAYGLMEAGVLAIDGNNESELRKIDEIILNILLKAGEKDNYTI